MKKKVMGLLALSLLLGSCGVKKDSYTSTRHPEGEPTSVEETEESTDITYTREGENSQEEENQTEENQTEENQETNEEATGDENVDGVEYEANGNINMRLAPSTDSGVVTEVPGGARVIKIGENGEWTRATYEGYTGYILTELLTPVN